MESHGNETHGEPRWGRWVLAIAALIAVAAIGWTLVRDGAGNGGAVVEAGDTQQPSVPEMIAALEARLAENPQDAQGWSMLGWAYFRTERFAEAATALKRATALAPDNGEYHSMLGEALVLASNDGDGLPADAVAAFDRALEIDPADPRARYFRAVAMDLGGDHRGAIDAWFALMEDTPSDAPYAADIRQVIVDVADAHDMDVADRLAATNFAPPALPETDGPQVATAGIPGPTRQAMQDAAALPEGQQQAMIRDMVDGLDARLATNPGDADGWIMLMRSRMQLGERAAARRAFERADAAFATDPVARKRIREAAAALGVPTS